MTMRTYSRILALIINRLCSKSTVRLMIVSLLILFKHLSRTSQKLTKNLKLILAILTQICLSGIIKNFLIMANICNQIYSHTISTNNYPNKWKITIISSIPKVNNPHYLANYRLVSSLNLIVYQKFLKGYFIVNFTRIPAYALNCTSLCFELYK